MNKVSKKLNKILVALSGGVDSAVAAAILKKQGYEVVGVHFRFFNSTWKLSFQVRGIAKKLGIPLKIIDARKEFKKRVIDYFLNTYKIGLTPNPCVVCNKEMKFRLLFDLMKKMTADAVATGHYASIKVRPAIQGSTFPSADKSANSSRSNLWGIPQGRTLREAKDKTKDQSYFLYRLTQKDLAKIIFPLGDYKKSEVKKIAEKMRLPVRENESQDICFLENNDIRKYLCRSIGLKPGNIIDEAGKILGRHKGLPLYTIGQRKGIEIGGAGPFWVIRKNAGKNELLVTGDPKKLLTKKFLVNKVNWISQDATFPLRVKARVRYRAPKVSAIIKELRRESCEVRNRRWEVRSERNLRAVTAGQSAVFYQGGEVLGGGTII